MTRCDVVILGAGPYGLAAAHLRHIPGSRRSRLRRADGILEVAHAGGHAAAISVGGVTYFRSSDSAHDGRFRPTTRYSNPQADSSGSFCRIRTLVSPAGSSGHRPPQIARIDRGSQGFQVTLSDGEKMQARRVVVAAGIGVVCSTAKSL